MPILLAVQGFVAVVLLTGLWLAQPGEPAAAPLAPPKINSEALSHVANLLASERLEVEHQLAAPLMRDDERGVGDFAALQVQAADLELVGLSWRSLPVSSDLVPVELTVRAMGSYYNLPILVDGLYRQSHPMEITYLAVETPKMMVAHTEATLRLRFYRPTTLSSSSLYDHLQPILGSLRSRAAEVVLEEAARIQLLQDFGQRVEELELRSATNRSQIMTSLPAMLRRLPSTALGWVGMEQTGDQMILISDPG